MQSQLGHFLYFGITSSIFINCHNNIYSIFVHQMHQNQFLTIVDRKSGPQASYSVLPQQKTVSDWLSRFLCFEIFEFNSTQISMWVSGKSRYVFFVDIIQTQYYTAFQNIQNYWKRCSELGERANKKYRFFACKKPENNGELHRTPLKWCPDTFT